MQASLTPTAKNVATALAVQFANEKTGQCNPSRQTLADYIGSHPDHVKRALKMLKDGGWVVVVSGRGRGRSTDYQLTSPGKVIALGTMKRGQICTPEKGEELSPQSQEKGDNSSAKGGGFVPSHYKEEQSLEQRARAREQSACACPIDRPVHIECNTHRHQAWNDWLRERGWPSVAELALDWVNEGTSGYAVPSTMPPSEGNEHAENTTTKFLNWAIERAVQKRRAGVA